MPVALHPEVVLREISGIYVGISSVVVCVLVFRQRDRLYSCGSLACVEDIDSHTFWFSGTFDLSVPFSRTSPDLWVERVAL